MVGRVQATEDYDYLEVFGPHNPTQGKTLSIESFKQKFCPRQTLTLS